MFHSKTMQVDPLPANLVSIAWLLVLGAMAPMLDSTMVNIAVNQLRIDFGTSLALIQWTVTGFILAMGAAVPFSSWLVDRFSGKMVYFWSEIAFGVASLLAGLSGNVEMLIALRIVQGFAAGMIMPVMFTLLVDLFGGDKMGRVMSIIGVPMTLGPMAGPIIGGLIVQLISWRWIFFIDVPIVLISALMLYKKVPAIAPKNPSATFDGFGVGLLVALSVTFVYGTVQASTTGSFNNQLTVGFGALTIVILIGYLLYAWRYPNTAVLPLRLFKHRNFSGAMLGNLLAGFITSGPMILLPLFFQDVRGESVIMAAVSLIPQSVGMLVSRGTIGKLIDTIGARWVVITGTVLTIISTLPFVFFDAQTAYWLIAIVMFVRGVGGAAVKSAIQADAYVGIDRADSGKASLGSNLFQQVGSAFGSAVLATLVAGFVSAHHIVQTAQLLGAYQYAFAWGTVFVVLMIVPAFMLTHKVK